MSKHEFCFTVSFLVVLYLNVEVEKRFSFFVFRFSFFSFSFMSHTVPYHD